MTLTRQTETRDAMKAEIGSIKGRKKVVASASAALHAAVEGAGDTIPASAYGSLKKKLAAENTLCTRPIPRLDGSILPTKKLNGNSSRYRYTPTRMKNGINAYFKWCETEDELPSIKGMMIHLKMYKDMFYKYVTRPDYTDIMEHARLIIANWAETDVYQSKGMAAGKIAYMKNIHGWADKLETNNTTEVRTVTVEQARAKIEMLAPKLLELLQSPTLLNQLVTREPTSLVHRDGEIVVDAEVTA